MIPDEIFKNLQHSYKGYSAQMNGLTLEAGYLPDIVLKKGDEYIIIESENSSSRKTFVGGMMKAAHFLRGDRNGKPVFGMVPKGNTSAMAIARHLRKYLTWIQSIANLRHVFVIEANLYYTNSTVIAFKELSYTYWGKLLLFEYTALQSKSHLNPIFLKSLLASSH
jgi:hypothetical protein